MDQNSIQPFLDALTAKNYVLFGALAVGLLVALAKQGWLSRWLASKLPAAALPYLSVALGALGVSAAEVVAGKDVKSALVHGVLAGVLAVFGHEVVVESARGGKEIVPERKPGDASPPAASAGVLLFVVGMTCGIAGNTMACKDPNVPAEIVNAIPDDAACALAIIDDVGGSIDIAKTAATCGVAVEKIIAIVSQLLDKTPDAAAGTKLNQHRRAWLASAHAFKASHP